jgi:hypothetical protein
VLELSARVVAAREQRDGHGLRATFRTVAGVAQLVS